MPSAQAEFVQEVARAHRHALKALYDILRDTATPAEPAEDESDDGADDPSQLTEAQRLSLRLRAATALLRLKADEEPGEDNDDEPDDDEDADEKGETNDDKRNDNEPNDKEPSDKEPSDSGPSDNATAPPSPGATGEGGRAGDRMRVPSSSPAPPSSRPHQRTRASKRRSRSKPPRPPTPAEIKAARAKATFEAIARANEAAYQDLLKIRARAQQQREAAAHLSSSQTGEDVAPRDR